MLVSFSKIWLSKTFCKDRDGKSEQIGCICLAVKWLLIKNRVCLLWGGGGGGGGRFQQCAFFEQRVGIF